MDDPKVLGSLSRVHQNLHHRVHPAYHGPDRNYPKNLTGTYYLYYRLGRNGAHHKHFPMLAGYALL